MILPTAASADSVAEPQRKRRYSSAETGNVPEVSAVNVDELPTEILTRIMSNLSRAELIGTVAPVCRLWYELAYDPLRWRSDKISERKLPSAVIRKMFRKTPLLKSVTVSPVSLPTTKEPKLLSSRLVRLIGQCAAFCPELSKIRLSSTGHLTRSVIDAIVCKLPQLQTLSLEYCSWIGNYYFKRICELTELRELDISGGNHLKDDDLNKITTSLTKLEALNINEQNQITDALVFNDTRFIYFLLICVKS